jgi:hypothetical protein
MYVIFFQNQSLICFALHKDKFKILKEPLYSPELATSDYFQNKWALRSTSFTNDEPLISKVNESD